MQLPVGVTNRTGRVDRRRGGAGPAA